MKRLSTAAEGVAGKWESAPELPAGVIFTGFTPAKESERNELIPKVANVTLRDQAAVMVGLSLVLVGVTLAYGYHSNMEMVASVNAATRANHRVAGLAHL